MKHLIKLLPKKKQILKKYTEMSSHQLHAELPKQFKASKGQKLDLSSYFVFSFVRHPYDRLVSAFKVIYNKLAITLQSDGYISNLTLVFKKNKTEETLVYEHG